MGAARCHLCRRPGAVRASTNTLAWCPPDRVLGCYFRSRRRLGIPYAACLAWAARDLERAAVEAQVRGDHEQAASLQAAAAKWQLRADQEATRPPHLRAAAYRAYLSSAEWQELRVRVLDRAGNRCEADECMWGGGDLEVHHLTYQRFGHERLSDLVALCPPCHREWDDDRRESTAAGLSAYGRRVDGWARKVYGDDWESSRDFDDVAGEFDGWLEDREE